MSLFVWDFNRLSNNVWDFDRLSNNHLVKNLPYNFVDNQSFS